MGKVTVQTQMHLGQRLGDMLRCELLPTQDVCMFQEQEQ